MGSGPDKKNRSLSLTSGIQKKQLGRPSDSPAPRGNSPGGGVLSPYSLFAHGSGCNSIGHPKSRLGGRAGGDSEVRKEESCGLGFGADHCLSGEG